MSARLRPAIPAGAGERDHPKRRKRASAASVRGDSACRHAARGFGVLARSNMGGSPGIGAPAHVSLALIRCHPGMGRGMIDDSTGFDVTAQAKEGEVPANAHRAWAKLCPVLIHVRSMHDVFESK